MKKLSKDHEAQRAERVASLNKAAEEVQAAIAEVNALIEGKLALAIAASSTPTPTSSGEKG